MVSPKVLGQFCRELDGVPKVLGQFCREPDSVPKSARAILLGDRLCPGM